MANFIIKLLIRYLLLDQKSIDNWDMIVFPPKGILLFLMNAPQKRFVAVLKIEEGEDVS